MNLRFLKSLLAILFVCSSMQAESLNLGSSIPQATVKMKNIDGKSLSIDDIKGTKGTLVIFSCNHCPYVKAWQSRFVALGNSYQKKGIGVIAINPNDPAVYPEDSYEVMQERARDNQYQFPYVVDATSDVARAFGATHTPEAFLFDSEGRLVYHGAIDDDLQIDKVTKQYLSDALDALIDGKPIPTPETKSVGCGIKMRAKN